MKDNPATKQRGFRFIGLVLQTFGGAMSWISVWTLILAGMAAWSSEAMLEVRRIFPWLNLFSFIGIVLAGILFMMWLQHKYAQPSIMKYWNKMFYEQDNPMTADLKAIKKKLGIEDNGN